MKAKFDTSVILSNKIAKVAIFFAISFFFYIFNFTFLAFVFFAISCFLVFIYRNPERYVYRNENEILSPVDGTVEAIDILENETKIWIYKSLGDASVVRMPEDGKFEILSKRNGVNVNPFMPKAKILNEYVKLKFDNFEIDLFGGLFGEKFEFIKFEDKLSKGDRIGSFVNGLCFLTLQKGFASSVKIGQKVKAGETPICALKNAQ